MNIPTMSKTTMSKTTIPNTTIPDEESFGFLDCIIKRNGTYDIQGMITKGVKVQLNLHKEIQNGEIEKINKHEVHIALFLLDKIEIYRLVEGKFVKVRNTRKNIGELIDEYCRYMCPDYDLFSKPIVETDEEIDIEESKNTENENTSKKSKKSSARRSRYTDEADPLFTTRSALSFKGRRVIVKGHVQSGKSIFMISASFNFIKCGLSVVIVLRNSEKDKMQIKSRLQKTTQKLYEWLPDEYKGQFVVKMLPDSFKEADLSGHTVYISIGNETQLKKYADTVDANPDLHEKFVLFVDEVDFVDSLNTAVKTQLDRLKAKCFARFEVSATILDPLLTGDVDSGNVYVMRTPEFYKGISNFTHYPLKKENKMCVGIDDDFFENDPNLEDYIREMSIRPLDDINYRMSHYNKIHPIVSLLRIALSVDPNKRLLAYMKKNYPQIPSMFFSAEGVYLSIEHFERITLYNGDRSKIVKLSTRKDGELEGSYHLFQKSAPGDVLTWLYENGGVEKYPRILMCAGVLAARGISFGASNFNECREEGKLWWHLSEMYVSVAKSTDQAELMQIVGRLAGIYNDNLVLRLYATKKVHEDVRKAYWVQEEFITRARESFTKSMRESIVSMPIYRGKLSSRDLTKKAEYTLNKVKTEKDGGLSMEEYKVKFVEELKEKVDEKKEKKKEETGNVPITMDLAEFERLTKTMFPKWSTSDSKIASFMKNLDPLKEYTEKEMRELCKENGISRIIQVTYYKIPGSGTGFGCILQKKNNKYKMYSELVNEFYKYF
jgi:hypothetical protein